MKRRLLLAFIKRMDYSWRGVVVIDLKVRRKMSGMVTEANHQYWTAKDIASYMMHVLTVFGEDRVMFGGDWPVLLLASSYLRWIETVDVLTSHTSSSAMRKFWSENARRIYRLNNIA